MSDKYEPKPFQCEVSERDGVVHLTPVGDLDMGTAPVVEEALRGALAGGARSLVLDLRGLQFMDSTGLTLITRFNNESQDDGFRLALVPGPARVMRLFELTGLAAYFTFIPG